jgi:dodecin
MIRRPGTQTYHVPQTGDAAEDRGRGRLGDEKAETHPVPASRAVLKPTAGPGVGPEGEAMSNRTYRVTEIVGTSPESIDAAIRNGLARAAETLRHLDWFEVTEIRGHLDEGTIDHIQVGMKVGFRLEDS